MDTFYFFIKGAPVDLFLKNTTPNGSIVCVLMQPPFTYKVPPTGVKVTRLDWDLTYETRKSISPDNKQRP